MSQTTIDHLLEGLNDVQRAAVQDTEGPVLIHAGAGSGKTRVLTHRVAYLIQNRKVNPAEILAVTFTNKAAKEMRERILALASGAAARIWIGTFHSISARILRVEAEKLGYERNFLIFDRDDQLKFIKQVLRELYISEKEYPPNSILSAISGAKSAFVGPQEYRNIAREPFEETVAQVYGHYQKLLKESNGMDFDDLLVNPIYLFQEHPQVLEHYQTRFNYLLVDEYQDTNRTQYLFLQKLAARHKNLCVVGDDDQSIYRWRGADIQNILNIEKDYPGCKVYRLEQNYRSTKHILNVANSVVRNNKQRLPKKLWTANAEGEKAKVLAFEDQIAESLHVVTSIKEELHDNGRNFCDFVILYRTNAQSRVLEDALRAAGIPYIIVGGVRFYERKEIKDVLAYLRLICNPRDSISLKRVINFPLRGIGDTSVEKLEQFAKESGIPLLEAADRADEIESISARIQTQIKQFHNLIKKYASLRVELSAGELVRTLVDEIGILRKFKEMATEESYGHGENVGELLSALDNFSKRHNGNDLECFLEEVSLITDIDSWDDRSNAVTLMTLHSAKGLEFPVVYMTGLEEGLFPLSRSLNTNEELEEERRLFYVGATRAEERLYMTWAARRLRYGEYFENVASRFLAEVDDRFVERIDHRRTYRERPHTEPQRGSTNGRRQRDQETMPAYEDFSQDAQSFYVGCEVRHPSFGLGKIVGMDGRGETAKLSVKFHGVGVKRLLVKYAKLETVG